MAAWIVFRNSVDMAGRELLERTQESNSFAAESVAARLALEVDKRWRILEHEATSPELQRWLTSRNAEDDTTHVGAAATADDATDESPTPDDGSLVPAASSPHPWIASRYKLWNNQFGEKGKAAYWFVLDRAGRLQTISPMEEELIGKYFG